MTKIVILVIVQLCQLGGSEKGVAERMYTRTAVRKHAFPNIGPKTRFYAGGCMIMRAAWSSNRDKTKNFFWQE